MLVAFNALVYIVESNIASRDPYRGGLTHDCSPRAREDLFSMRRYPVMEFET